MHESKNEDGKIRAVFPPEPAVAFSQSSATSPLTASALANIFPYLLLIDNVLEIITWTNDDPYLNFLFLFGYTVIVFYWKIVSYVFLPLLMCISFSCVIWSINSVIYDSVHNEEPTIEEALNTLHNISVRVDMILRPLRNVVLSGKDFLRMSISAVLLSPIYILLLKFVIKPRIFVLLSGVFALTYHSSWSISIRRLLWRSVYVRMVAFYITGLDITIVRNRKQIKPLNSKVNHDYKVIKKSSLSFDKEGQIIEFRVLENQRRWIGIGWCGYLLPYERSPFTNENLIDCKNLGEFSFPKFHNTINYKWKWIEDNWDLDLSFNEKASEEGWVYYDNNWSNSSNEDSFSRYTRSRMWKRRALLVMDKESNT